MADRHRYQVSLCNRDSERPRAFGLIFECTLPTVAAVAEELHEFGIVHGTRLTIGPDSDGRRTVMLRTAYAFGVSAVVSIQPYAHDLLEAA
jgi:hypothetical protein